MTIVFFLPVILRDQHRHIYPLEQLEKEGYKVVILDATQYFKVYHRTATDEYLLNRIEECKTKEDFVKFKNRLGDNPVLYVTNELYMKMAEEILNLLVREQDKLLTASTRLTPGHFNQQKGYKKILRNTIRFSDNFLPLYLFKFYYQNLKKIYVPDYFLSSTKFLTPTKVYLSVKKEKRIYVHSDDVNNAYKPLKQIIDPETKTGVFLDQMQPYFGGSNPDVHDKEFNKEYKVKYYQNVVKTLEEIKKALKLDDIIIALHPEADAIRDEIDEKYQPFKTFTGVSYDLIKDANIVFGHFSTAIGMAAFFEKPIVLFTDEFMLNDRSIKGAKAHKAVKAYEEELGLKIIRSDKWPLELTKEDLKFDRKLYNRHRNRFLKENDYEGNSYFFAIQKIKSDLQKFA